MPHGDEFNNPTQQILNAYLLERDWREHDDGFALRYSKDGHANVLVPPPDDPLYAPEHNSLFDVYGALAAQTIEEELLEADWSWDDTSWQHSEEERSFADAEAALTCQRSRESHPEGFQWFQRAFQKKSDAD